MHNCCINRSVRSPDDFGCIGREIISCSGGQRWLIPQASAPPAHHREGDFGCPRREHKAEAEKENNESSGIRELGDYSCDTVLYDMYNVQLISRLKCSESMGKSRCIFYYTDGRELLKFNAPWKITSIKSSTVERFITSRCLHNHNYRYEKVSFKPIRNAEVNTIFSS